ncbi:hypothetical protein [Acinetobacter pullicarnis]|uniref:hypothetical protein n=1 Tax=Acinetobacter pullicarnis TaxID=2576829 RepID=UPI00111D33A8|nr:hypothetical protein [Acinetobacter pullicarnis]
MNLYTLWKYKSWIAIAVLSFVCLGQLAYTNHLAGQLIKADGEKAQAVADAVEPYEEANAKARADAVVKERQYSENLLKAEQNAIEKIKAANADAHSADLAANSLSKQLDKAKRNLPSASTKTIIEYVNTGSDVLEECGIEATRLAKAADGHAIDAKRLSEAWPSD